MTANENGGGTERTAPSAGRLRLGVNVDHVATVRNARGGRHPDPLRAAHTAVAAGADGITAHLREDRRHITDDDLARLKAELTVPLNMEMAATAEMTGIALATLPNACCLVPEKREERTTEGGLDVVGGGSALRDTIGKLKSAGIRVSLFVEPDTRTIDAAADYGADIVELHTGTYCERALENTAEGVARELARIASASRHAASRGLEVHAGHGLTYNTVGPVAAMPEMRELNIGHFLIGEALYFGLADTVGRMLRTMRDARADAGN